MDEQCVSHGSPQRGRDTQSQRQARPGAIRCGWLRKQGGFVKTWHSRWFVLRGEQLYYYKDEEETKALVRTLTHLSLKLKGSSRKVPTTTGLVAQPASASVTGIGK